MTVVLILRRLATLVIRMMLVLRLRGAPATADKTRKRMGQVQQPQLQRQLG